MKEKIKRMRTVRQMVEEIKKDDPESCVTRYMIKSIIDANKLSVLIIGNKHFYDFDLVLKGLGISYEQV